MNPEFDLKLIKKEFKKIFSKNFKKVGFARRIWSVLIVFKVSMLHLFTLIGVCFVFAVFFFGYSLHEDTDCKAELNYTKESLNSCYDIRWDIKDELDTCYDNLLNISNSCYSYCLEQYLRPTCEVLQ